MNKGSHYTQCLLSRNGSKQHAWIPKQFADPGRMIRIREDGKWQDGWQVLECFDSLPEEVVKRQANYYKSTRNGSDI